MDDRKFLVWKQKPPFIISNLQDGHKSAAIKNGQKPCFDKINFLSQILIFYASETSFFYLPPNFSYPLKPLNTFQLENYLQKMSKS